MLKLARRPSVAKVIEFRQQMGRRVPARSTTAVDARRAEARRMGAGSSRPPGDWLAVARGFGAAATLLATASSEQRYRDITA